MSVCASCTNEWTVRCAYLICIPLLRELAPPYKRRPRCAYASHLPNSFTDWPWQFVLCVRIDTLILRVYWAELTSGSRPVWPPSFSYRLLADWLKVQVNMNALCVSIFDLCLCVHFGLGVCVCRVLVWLTWICVVNVDVYFLSSWLNESCHVWVVFLFWCVDVWMSHLGVRVFYFLSHFVRNSFG